MYEPGIFCRRTILMEQDIKEAMPESFKKSVLWVRCLPRLHDIVQRNSPEADVLADIVLCYLSEELNNAEVYINMFAFSLRSTFVPQIMKVIDTVRTKLVAGFTEEDLNKIKSTKDAEIVVDVVLGSTSNAYTVKQTGENGRCIHVEDYNYNTGISLIVNADSMTVLEGLRHLDFSENVLVYNRYNDEIIYAGTIFMMPEKIKKTEIVSLEPQDSEGFYRVTIDSPDKDLQF